jgi:hypothetical protein
MVTKFWDTGSVYDRKYQIHFSVEEAERDCLFQTDRATAHTANTTAPFQEFFGESIIRCDLSTLRAQDLMPPDSFL